MNNLGWVAVATLLGGAAWTLPALVRREFRDPMRLTLFASMLLLGIGNLLSRPSVLAAVDGVTAPGVSKLTYNFMILVGLCLMVSFLRESPPTWPAALGRWEVVTCAVCVAGLLVVTVMIAPDHRDHQLTPASLTDAHVRAFYNIGNVYLIVGYVACAVLAWRHARAGSPTVRLALVTISAGLWGLAVSCVARVVWVDDVALRRAGGLYDYQDVLAFALLATIVVCIGMSLTCIGNVLAVLGEVRGHRRRYRGLEELWRLLSDVYPDLVLDRLPYLGGRLPTGYALATYRRYVECRDGLVRLGAAAPEAAPAALAIERAMLAQAEGAVQPGADVRGTVHEGYEQDLDALMQVSAALRRLRDVGATASV